MKNIFILAAIGSRNLWDELILKNEIALLRKEFWAESTFRVCSYDFHNPFYESQGLTYQEYFPIDAKNIQNIPRNGKNIVSFIRSVIWADIVVMGGGGIFYDSEYQSITESLRWWTWRAQKIRRLWKNIYFYAVGFDIKTQKWDEDIRAILDNAYKITVRDSQSQLYLETLGIQSEEVFDPVMYDAGLEYTPWKILWSYDSGAFGLKDLEQYDFKGKRVWVALRPGFLWKTKNEKIEKLLLQEILLYIESQWWSIILVPHSFHPSDARANDLLFLEQFVSPERKITRNMQESYELYTNNGLDIMIAMRLHSMILSHVYGIDQIALCYGAKTHSLIKKISS